MEVISPLVLKPAFQAESREVGHILTVVFGPLLLLDFHFEAQIVKYCPCEETGETHPQDELGVVSLRVFVEDIVDRSMLLQQLDVVGKRTEEGLSYHYVIVIVPKEVIFEGGVVPMFRSH